MMLARYFALEWDDFSDVTLTNVECPLSQFFVDAGALDGCFVQTGGVALDDCDYIGFDNAPSTPSPTEKPTSGGNCLNC